MSGFQRLSLGLLLLHLAAASAAVYTVPSPVFTDRQTANQVLVRQKRANSFLEEIKQGDMERECVEERCSWEEAREIFEDDQKTNEFWAKYVDGDACEAQPCAYEGVCKDTVGGYTCFCQAGYRGYNCEIIVPQLCENKNGGCEHFCSVYQDDIQCSCADGYYLGSDYTSCHSNETFKCGAIYTGETRSILRYERKNAIVENATVENATMEDATLENATVENTTTSNLTDLSANATNLEHESTQNRSRAVLDFTVLEQIIKAHKAGLTRIVNGEDCPPGECPWQALLMNEEHRGFCGGTILNEYIILTAAHCMNQSRFIYVKLGEFDVLVDHGNEVVHQVETIVTHNRYRPDTYHNDIALIKLLNPIRFTRFILPACIPESKFAEKVLMKQHSGMVSGFGRLGEGRQPSTILQRLSVPYVDRLTCMESTKLKISTRMFCAGYDQEAKDACQGDSGGPHVTRYHNTYFITGIVSWGEGCARKGKYGVYTQVSKYVSWIREGIERLVPKETDRNRLRRSAGPIKWLVL